MLLSHSQRKVSSFYNLCITGLRQIRKRQDTGRNSKYRSKVVFFNKLINMFAYASFRFRFMRYSMRSLRSEKTVPNRMNRIKEIHNFFLNFITFSLYRISLPSGILEIIVRLVLNRKISETISDMTSAVRKAHHTA